MAEIKREFGDSRVQYCQVEMNELAGERRALTGGVLDGETLTAVTSHLSSQFPSIIFDAAAVQILRQSPPRLATVGTNLTGVHRETARASERVSELLNGRVVEKLMERDGWVFVRQMDGYLGWINRLYLTESPPPEPTHIVIAPVSLLRAKPESDAVLVSRVMGGTMVAVTGVTGSWAHLVLAGDKEGWVLLADLRAIDAFPTDEDGRRQQMVQDALQFIGVQYLWGGNTAQGIDCSGFVQMLHRMVGVNILRDADMQFEVGSPVGPPFQPGDLLFFGSGKGYRNITHVGMSLGGWKIIHSSGPRNGVYVDDAQAVSWLRNVFAGTRTFVGSK
ncbi:MAG: hypothetical protein GY803_06045 [Chloroflexi bacterium]|nr:hypothetical protein [Chloroflexota bacterium]